MHHIIPTSLSVPISIAATTNQRNDKRKKGQPMHMSQTGTSTKQQKDDGSSTKVDMKLEVDIIPVSDVERSKQFYKRLGWRFDDDAAPTNGIRIVQFTPPGSSCSVTFGKGLTP